MFDEALLLATGGGLVALGWLIGDARALLARRRARQRAERFQAERAAEARRRRAVDPLERERHRIGAIQQVRDDADLAVRRLKRAGMTGAELAEAIEVQREAQDELETARRAYHAAVANSSAEQPAERPGGGS